MTIATQTHVHTAAEGLRSAVTGYERALPSYLTTGYPAKNEKDLRRMLVTLSTSDEELSEGELEELIYRATIARLERASR